MLPDNNFEGWLRFVSESGELFPRDSALSAAKFILRGASPHIG